MTQNAKTKEVKLVAGEEIIPDDQFTIADKVYGDRHFVRKGEGYEEVTKPPVTPIRVHQDRTYIMSDAASFVTAIEKCGGDPKTGIIFYQGDYGKNNTRITMFFDEKTRRESIVLPLTLSLEMQSFFNSDDLAGTGEFDQKSFLKLIDTFPECVSADSMTAAILRGNVEKMQLSTEIKFESNLDKDNLEFVYKEKTGGAQTGKLPKKLMLTLPYYEGSSNKIEIGVDLEVVMPKNEGEKPVFTITNIKHERTEREALKSEIESLGEELYQWVFCNGK